jgi:hypothetical protein
MRFGTQKLRFEGTRYEFGTGREVEVRIDVTPEQASNMESFAIYFPMVLRDEAVMRLHWGTTAVPIRIKAPFRPQP